MSKLCFTLAAAALWACVGNGAQAAWTFSVTASSFNDPAGRVNGQFVVTDLNGNSVVDQPAEFVSWRFDPSGFNMGQGFVTIADTLTGAQPVAIAGDPLLPLGFGLNWTGAVFEVFDPGRTDVVLSVGSDGFVQLLNGETGAFDESAGTIQPVPGPPALLLAGSALAVAVAYASCSIGKSERAHSCKLAS